MTAMTFRPGELVNVQLKGVRYVRHEPDGALTVQTNDPDEHLWALPPQAAVERVAPKEWPPQVGDIWADRHDREYLGRIVETDEYTYHLLVSIDADRDMGSEAGVVAETNGPMRLVRRRGWTPDAPPAAPTPYEANRRAKLVAGLRAVAEWIERHAMLPVSSVRDHDMSIGYCAGSVAELERMAERLGVAITTDHDSGHMHADAEIDGYWYRAFHVPAKAPAVADGPTGVVDEPTGPAPLADAEPAEVGGETAEATP